MSKPRRWYMEYAETWAVEQSAYDKLLAEIERLEAELEQAKSETERLKAELVQQLENEQWTIASIYTQSNEHIQEMKAELEQAKREAEQCKADYKGYWKIKHDKVALLAESYGDILLDLLNHYGDYKGLRHLERIVESARAALQGEEK